MTVRYDRRNVLLPYDRSQDGHLDLLDIHAVPLLKTPKTVSEVRRHLVPRLTTWNERVHPWKRSVLLADDYITQRWLNSAEARGLARQVSPELWELSRIARLRMRAKRAAKRAAAKHAATAAAHSASGGVAAATPASAAAKAALTKTAVGVGVAHAAPVVAGLSLTAGPLVAPWAAPHAWDHARKSYKNKREAWFVYGIHAEFERWLQADLLEWVTGDEYRRRFHHAFESSIQREYRELTGFDCASAGGPQRSKLSRKRRLKDAEARAELLQSKWSGLFEHSFRDREPWSDEELLLLYLDDAGKTRPDPWGAT